ncbi:translation elongation factor Ts [Desulfothermobacter acidiphilus]|uniref:translation elongation factor Ts n=1 Tax=Desulfothermobacter acidiphilus TaxID=1938353 RepID=UPI003F8AAE76
MAEISAKLVKELRERTGAGMMDCKKALMETEGDLEKALVYLREKGLAAAAKRAGRKASEGVVTAYIHPGNRVGVLVEVNCETDFVARTEDFQQFAHDIALQVAAAKPEYVAREDVPAEVLEREKEILRAQARNEGKPEQVIEKVVEGRVEKFFKERCLLEQPFIKNPEITVRELLNELIAKIGENIVVRRFTRYELGEGI